MSAELQEVIDQGKLALGKLSMPMRQKELPSEIRGEPGVYVFYAPDGNPLYVGRTRNLLERIRQHSRASTKDAPFAWLLAREETGHRATYRTENGRKALLQNPDFLGAFQRAKNQIASMNVAFVVVQDDTVQYLVEVLARYRSKLGLIHSARHKPRDAKPTPIARKVAGYLRPKMGSCYPAPRWNPRGTAAGLISAKGCGRKSRI